MNSDPAAPIFLVSPISGGCQTIFGPDIITRRRQALNKPRSQGRQISYIFLILAIRDPGRSSLSDRMSQLKGLGPGRSLCLSKGV